MIPWREGSSPTISSVFGKDPPAHTSGSFDVISIDVPPPVQHQNLTSQSPVTHLANGLNNLGLRTDKTFSGQHRGNPVFQQQSYQHIPQPQQLAPHVQYFHAPMNMPPPPQKFVPPFGHPFNPIQNHFTSRPPPLCVSSMHSLAPQSQEKFMHQQPNPSFGHFCRPPMTMSQNHQPFIQQLFVQQAQVFPQQPISHAQSSFIPPTQVPQTLQPQNNQHNYFQTNTPNPHQPAAYPQ
ncbi:hypothetical protein DFH28DRAFT_1117783 [Melampsora americana]|nr:hypothetical protein DFH28DRAFT_1117783 [Melampsora americana]